jgi:multiple sugar transport system permease protein
MAGTATTLDRPAAVRPLRRMRWHGGGVRRSDALWAAAFVLPYIAVFLLFVVWPVSYGLWLGSHPASYRALFADPIFARTVLNTVLFLAIGVNVKLFAALLLSGFFMRPGRCRRSPPSFPSIGC